MRLLFTLLVLAGWSLAGCSNGEDLPGGSGLMEATESVVSSETAGRVLAKFVDEGDFVSTGDTLALIDTTQISLQLSAARAGLKATRAKLEASRTQLQQSQEAESYAARELNRVEKLKGSGTATDQQLDRITYDHTQAVIAVQSARAGIAVIEAEIDRLSAEIERLVELLDDCTPQSPMSGVITESYVDVGELLAPGRPILKVSRLDTLEVKVYLPAGSFAAVAIGDSASVDTESGGTIYPGRVTWTSEEAEFTPKNVQTAKTRANLVFAVKVSVPNTDGKLKIGMPVYVTLHD